eukprot:354564-Chlamydomonas_euryale.AAC.1
MTGPCDASTLHVPPAARRAAPATRSTRCAATPPARMPWRRASKIRCSRGLTLAGVGWARHGRGAGSRREEWRAATASPRLPADHLPTRVSAAVRDALPSRPWRVAAAARTRRRASRRSGKWHAHAVLHASEVWGGPGVTGTHSLKSDE